MLGWGYTIAAWTDLPDQYEPVKERFLPPIPKGHQIYADLGAKGLTFYKENVIRFIQGYNQGIKLEREPDNPKDPNAIELIGLWTDQYTDRDYATKIGYVPRQAAAVVAELCIFEEVLPRLRKIYLGRDGYAEVDYQITGPKARTDEFKSAFAGQFERDREWVPEDPVPSALPDVPEPSFKAGWAWGFFVWLLLLILFLWVAES